jgi:hypothetical protein
MKGNTMNILKHLDNLHPPYSTLLSLTLCVLLGLYLVLFRPETGSLGHGIILGAISAIVIEKAAECSDKAVLSALIGKFKPKA